MWRTVEVITADDEFLVKTRKSVRGRERQDHQEFGLIVSLRAGQIRQLGFHEELDQVHQLFGSRGILF